MALKPFRCPDLGNAGVKDQSEGDSRPGDGGGGGVPEVEWLQNKKLCVGQVERR